MRNGWMGWCCAALLAVGLEARAQEVTEPDSTGRIGNWLLLGTYPHGGCAAPLASPIDPQIASPTPGCRMHGGRTWQQYSPKDVGGQWTTQCVASQSCNGGLVSADMNCFFGGTTSGSPSFVMGYAFTYLTFAHDTAAFIHSGSDDGYRIWIDGTLTVNAPNACRCWADSQEVTPYTFSAGTHRVLVQVGEAGGHWGFVFALRDAGGAPINTGVVATSTSPEGGGCPDLAPILTNPGNQVRVQSPTCDGTVAYNLPVATDDRDTSLAVSCSPPSGTVIAPGTHTILCSTIDSGGNTASVQFTLTVLERLVPQFLPPTDPTETNVFQPGQTVPTKLQVSNCAGEDRTAAVATGGFVRLDALRRLQIGGGTFLSGVFEQSNGLGSAGGLMEPVGSPVTHFQFNLDTSGYPEHTLPDPDRDFLWRVQVFHSPFFVPVGVSDAVYDSR